jgi:oligopeptide/dipeptide ABC transporter ATP-binding protein
MGFKNRDRIFSAYPHQLSGGQRRRISVAQALVCKPRLVLADEPTAGLDSKTTTEMIELFSRFRGLYGTSFLLISHDPEALTIADRIMVMYAGEIVECGTRQEVFERPKHPYTIALMRCRQIGEPNSSISRFKRLFFIPGRAPDPSDALVGCSFAARCPDRMEICEVQLPEARQISPTHSARCLKYGSGGSTL